MIENLLLLGAKGVAKKVIEIVREQSEYSKISLLDNYIDYNEVLSCPIIGKCDDLENYKNDFSHVFICMADPRTRGHYLQKAKMLGFQIPNIIHPCSYISKSAKMGTGILVHAMAVVQSSSKIDDGCVIGTGAVVEHDNELGYCTSLAPKASTSGYVKIGNYTFVGGGAQVTKVTIGNNVLVAAGAVVNSDVPNNVMVAGIPAKIKKSITEIKHSIWPGTYPEGRF